MIEIKKLQSTDIAAVKNVQLASEQIKFASTSEEFLLGGSETIHLHIIKYEGQVVGFFKLDTDYCANYDFCPKAGIGLRTLAIDKSCQGKGIGKAAVLAISSYVKHTYPKYQFIYLTVNCQNPVAEACYIKAGYEFSGEKYLGGEAGPQHIMYMNLAEKQSSFTC